MDNYHNNVLLHLTYNESRENFVYLEHAHTILDEKLLVGKYLDWVELKHLESTAHSSFHFSVKSELFPKSTFMTNKTFSKQFWLFTNISECNYIVKNILPV